MATTRNVRPPTIEAFYASSFMWEQAEKQTQTFLTGALLVNASGYAQESAADPTDGTLLGIAEGAGQNGASDGLYTSKFTPFLPGTIIEANLCAGASADTKALAQTDIGTKYGLIKRTTSGATHWVIDSTETVAVKCKIIGVRDPIGDFNGRVWAVMLNTSIFFGG